MNKNNKSFLEVIKNEQTKDFIDIHDILQIISEKKEYIFRKEDWWYHYKEWVPPYSGKIEIWKNNNNDDWTPKKEYSEFFNESNSITLIDLQKPPTWLDDSIIVNVIFTDKNLIGILVRKNFLYSIYICPVEDLENVIMKINNLYIDGGIEILEDRVIFIRNDQSGRPADLCSQLFSDHTTNVIYSANTASSFLELVHIDSSNVLIIDKNYLQEDIILFSIGEENNFKKIWDKQKTKPILLTSFKNNISHFIGLVVKSSQSELMFILFNLKNNFISYYYFEKTIKIKYIKDISETTFLISYYNDGILKHGFFDINQKQLESSKKILKIRSSDLFAGLTLYQNNFSPNSIFFIDKNDINIEHMYNFDINNKKLELSFSNIIFSKKEEIIKEIVYAPSRDGFTKIPITLLYKKNSKKKAGIINVYGAYGQKESTSVLDPTVLSIVENNFVYAIAHVRGGGFLGGDWYRAGKKLKKWNSIYDFLDCCDFLIKHNYIDENSLGALASSAGGIVLGAALNERPNLFKSVLFFSPFINPYRVMMEKDDFLSKTESIEWGDPLTSDEINNYILSYSPSQNTYKINNITTEVLIIIGAQDKLVSNNDVLVWHENLVKKRAKAFIYVNENAGHGGITTTDERLFSNILSHFLYKINRC